MIPAQEALKLLRDGNRRFASDTRNGDSATGSRRRIELAAQQYPFAIIHSRRRLFRVSLLRYYSDTKLH